MGFRSLISIPIKHTALVPQLNHTLANSAIPRSNRVGTCQCDNPRVVLVIECPIFLADGNDLFPVARTRNVVLFGECGVGKSSIINAIAGRQLAVTSNNVLGCTIENMSYSVTLESGVELKLWDTIGLDEGTFGSIPAGDAKQRLKDFLKTQIAAPDGLDLLLYCFRGASGMKGLPVKQGHLGSYKFVFQHVCNKRVPIAMVATNLDSYNPNGSMDAWWDDNEQKLSEFGFQFCAHACVSVLPKELCDTHDDIDRIEVSRRKLRDLLEQDYLAPRNVLLLGVREDRADFIDMTIAKEESNRKVEDSPPFTHIPIAFDAHTHVHFWNASKLDESDDDVLVTEKNIKLLIQGVNHTGGIDLLLFCFRAGRPKVRHARNYHFFHAAICRKKVPVAIVVLGSDEGSHFSWWQRNERDLRQRGLRFDRHVYVPCDPCQHPSNPLSDGTRHQLIDLLQEGHTLGSWTICDDAFWATVPNVRAVVAELSWPTTTVVVCDSTREGAFVRIAPSVQSSLQCASSPQREHRFQQIDPRSLLHTLSQSSGQVQPRVLDQGHKGVNLLMFLVSADGLDSQTWNTLERFYFDYDGNITPCIVVVHGIPDRRLAEDIWKDAPRRITRRVGAYVTHHPGSNACPDAQAAAQEFMVDMIRDLCLVDLGEKVGVLREILSVWRKYRSQRIKVSEGTAK